MANSPSTYVELDDINLSEKMLAYLSNEDDTTATIDQRPVQNVIRKAEAIVTSKIGVKLTVPLAEAYKSEVLKGWVSDITIYYLWQKKDKVIPDDVRFAYQTTLQQMDDFIDGRMVLGIATASEEAAKKGVIRTVLIQRGATTDE